jgi:hypothetical protein
MDPDPGRARRRLDRDLEQVARDDHRRRASEEPDPGAPPGAHVERHARPDVTPEDQAETEDEERRDDDVRVLRRRLPGWTPRTVVRLQQKA